MTLSIDGYPGDVSRRVTYLSASSPARPIASAGKEQFANASATQLGPTTKKTVNSSKEWTKLAIKKELEIRASARAAA